mmetsp:Transcript_95215/g.142670  ORF Transcript_95215/g.142670 Transcript_95215/m.142670 type:complete len:872 (-) Transcript_95215:144-2759(-)|eukprot:CAMPEP_0117026054 /NCGR_PEP_ID=MMETSP0472-20121206/19184_1 /TAXON_ID=693140 ORGANISM="Tiarina fusus, Strain LIS" /NCGR_SAMPLE_ID=MMETSP0472 /ASSEMBLY_ACC=CAM_ASM_000603 /LENGTH=871 /DNA_ID=CAMNT_0004732939 /DNA_START=67 /DNA_END=2682 /DNA_ORIENTATION=-
MKTNGSQEQNNDSKKHLNSSFCLSEVANTSTTSADKTGGWIVAGGKRKGTNLNSTFPKNIAKKKQSTASSSAKSCLKQNAFFLPKALETKLHVQEATSKKSSWKQQIIMKNPIESALKPSFLSIMTKGIDHIASSNIEVSDLERQRKSRNPMRVKKRFCKTDETPKALVFPVGLERSAPYKPAAVTEPLAMDCEPKKPGAGREFPTTADNLLDLPADVLSRGIFSFLEPKGLLSLGACSARSLELVGEDFLWKSHLANDFPKSKLIPASDSEWKMAYRLESCNLAGRMRCFHTKKTFIEDVLGLGVDFTVNPKTRRVDYIAVSQDLTSRTAFHKEGLRSDVFGNVFKLFLPLYFSREHFQRALPSIRKTIVKLCPEKKTSLFHPDMVLDVMPKIVTTFVVLLSDEGISASQKSFDGFTRIHRLFLALAQEYPSIPREALRRLNRFIAREEHRVKESCPNLGQILPLLMVVDPKECSWAKVRSAYLLEAFDRSVLWVCKKHPHLEKTTNDRGQGVESIEKGHERVTLTREAMAVPLRLTMFHVFFLKTTCGGTISERCRNYDAHFFQPEPEPDLGNKVVEESDLTAMADADDDETLATESSSTDAPASSVKDEKLATGLSFPLFHDQVVGILGITTWKKFFNFVGLAGPKSKEDTAKLLRAHVKNSRRKKYHKAGMDFSRVHASGSSKLLKRGQEYSASNDLKRVVFENHWNFEGGIKYLDASCLLYAGKKRLDTIDYSNICDASGAVVHSGDVMEASAGTHIINLNLDAIPLSITACVFVLSAFAEATLADIISPSIQFCNADAHPSEDDPLCVYNLDSHDKISHLQSVIMCKLYRSPRTNDRWHVVAIGDSHRGSASNYGPIYDAVQRIL